MSKPRIGIDIGGTFTDLCILEDSGDVWSTKLLTTPDDPANGFVEILQRALHTWPNARNTREIVHATTIATNAILENNIARLGLITTRGFRDILEIGRHFRHDLYNLRLQKPPLLIPRHLRLEVNERMASDGSVVTPLDPQQTQDAVAQLLEAGVEVVLVCFLNSYANPSHEQAVLEMASCHPRTKFIASHAMCCEFREYERFSTAMLHGAVYHRVNEYLNNILKQLQQLKISAPLSVMQSHGGMSDAKAMMQRPGGILESGPAAGVMAAVELGRRCQQSDIISFDMGGTTTKATLLKSGKVSIRTDYEVGGGIQGGRGTGYPFRMPVVDLVEIGTGGGSLAEDDDVGQLHVGPRSAGAAPGPACYGRGGTRPTITDANVVLGRLSPQFFAAGQIELDVAAAKDVIHTQVAKPLGISLVEAAEGIITVANAQMVHAMELVSVERGFDPRDFVMVAFGGAGPMHAADLARELGCPRVIVPTEAGVQSAWGLLVADARREAASTIVPTPTGVDLKRLKVDYTAMVEAARRELAQAGFPDHHVTDELAVDVRYRGQAYEVKISLDEIPTFDNAMQRKIADLFHTQHQRLFGHSHPEADTHWVTLRATVRGEVPRPAVPHLPSSKSPLHSRVLLKQPMTFAGKTSPSPVYDRLHLAAGDHIPGPALILQTDASTVVPPHVSAEVQETGDIFLCIDI